MAVNVKVLTVGKWRENAYSIYYNQDVWLIDPGDDFVDLDNYFNLSEFNIRGIINTHGHFDHIGAVQDFKKKYQIPFFIHSKDKQLVRQGNLYRRLAGATTFFETPEIDGFLDKKSEIVIAGKNIKVHYVPGHTHGSVCFEIDNLIFSGDVIFKDSIGRVDLPGGNKDLLKESIKYILKEFKGYTIYPGHGQPFVLDETVVEVLKSIL